MTLSGSSVSVRGVSRFSDDSYGHWAGGEKNTEADRNTLSRNGATGLLHLRQNHFAWAGPGWDGDD